MGSNIKKNIILAIVLIFVVGVIYIELVKGDFNKILTSTATSNLNSNIVTVNGLSMEVLYDESDLIKEVDYDILTEGDITVIEIYSSKIISISGESNNTIVRFVTLEEVDSNYFNLYLKDLNIDVSNYNVSPITFGTNMSVSIGIYGSSSLISSGDNAGISMCQSTDCEGTQLIVNGTGSLTVDALGNAAAIGGDSYCNSGIISINNGDITAKSKGGAAIGAGLDGYSGSISVTSAIITTSSEAGYDFIGNKGFLDNSKFSTLENSSIFYLSNPIQSDISLSTLDGLFIYDNKGYVYSVFVLETDLVLEDDFEIIPITNSSSFTVSSEASITNYKTLNNDSINITNNGVIYNYGTITSPSRVLGNSIENKNLLTAPDGGFSLNDGSIFITKDSDDSNYLNVTYGSENSSIYKLLNTTEIIINGDEKISSNRIVIQNTPVNLTFNSVNMETSTSPIIIENSSLVNLTLNGTSTMNYNNSSDTSVIYMDNSSLNMSGTGVLNVYNYSQLITSSNSSYTFDNATINLIISYDDKPIISASSININGGRINLNLQSNEYAKPLLAGCEDETCILTIEDGYINANDTYLGATKNIVTGGSVDVAGAINTAVNSVGVNVYPVEINLNSTSMIQEYYIKYNVSLNYLLPSYFENGKIVIFVPSGSYEAFLINDGYIYSVDYKTSSTAVVKAVVTSLGIHINSSINPYFINDNEIFLPIGSIITIGNNESIILTYGGIVTTSGELTMYNSNTNFITVTFYYNNGTVLSKDYEEGTILKNIGTPVKSGYTFIGWYINENLTIEYDFTELTSDISLYAKWSENISYENLENKEPVDYSKNEEVLESLEDNSNDSDDSEEVIIERVFVDVVDNSISFTFTEELFNSLSEKNSSLLILDTTIGILTIDKEMYEYLKDRYGYNVILTFTKYTESNPFDNYDVIISDDAVYKISLKTDFGDEIYSVDGNLTVEVPFDTYNDSAYIYYLNESSIIKKLSGVSVDSTKGTISFVTKYFTTYGISLSEQTDLNDSIYSSSSTSTLSEVNSYYITLFVLSIVLTSGYIIFRFFKTQV